MLGVLAAGAEERAARPNIIFILADDLGYQSLGAYGALEYVLGPKAGKAPVKTPNLDALAAGGMRFEHAYASPVCSPTRGQIMTGKYVHRIGLHDITGRRGAVEELDVKAHRTLPQLLREAGYDTALAGKWHLGGRPAPLEENPAGELKDSANAHIAAAGFLRQFNTFGAHLRQYGEPKRGAYYPDVIQAWVLRYLESRKGKEQPFFLYYAAPVPHTPLKPTPLNPDTPEEDARNFPFILEYFDGQIGEMAAKLDALGMRGNTAIFFGGDNGTQGIGSVMKDGTTRPGCKAQANDGGTRVPLLANWPGTIPPGGVYDGLVDYTDILPSLLDLAGAPAPEGIDGVSFAPVLRGQTGARREWVHALFLGRFFFRDARYALREDGKLYDMSGEAGYREGTAILEEAMDEAARASLARLRAARDRVLPGGWPPEELKPKLADRAQRDAGGK